MTSAALAATAFQEASAALFDAHPEIQSFGWTQYTPYFNDGDPCEFSANIEDPIINGTNEYGDGEDEDEEDEDGEGAESKPPSISKDLFGVVSAMLNQFDESDLEAMFGDHVRVTMRRGADWPSVDDYEHD